MRRRSSRGPAPSPAGGGQPGSAGRKASAGGTSGRRKSQSKTKSNRFRPPASEDGRCHPTVSTGDHRPCRRELPYTCRFATRPPPVPATDGHPTSLRSITAPGRQDELEPAHYAGARADAAGDNAATAGHGHSCVLAPHFAAGERALRAGGRSPLRRQPAPRGGNGCGRWERCWAAAAPAAGAAAGAARRHPPPAATWRARIASARVGAASPWPLGKEPPPRAQHALRLRKPRAQSQSPPQEITRKIRKWQVGTWAKAGSRRTPAHASPAPVTGGAPPLLFCRPRRPRPSLV